MDDRVDLLHPDVRANPYPVYAAMRRTRPVCQVEPGGMWAVAGYDDVQYVLKNPALFSSDGFRALLKPAWLSYNPIGDSLLVMDPPAHTKLRALVSRGFTSRGIARLEPRVRATAVALAEELLDKDEVDFVSELAAPLPARIIAEVLGIDVSLHRHFKRWGDHLATITPTPPDDALADAVRGTIAEMDGYLTEVVRARRRAPGGDMVSELIQARLDGEALSDAEIVAFLFVLLPAGFETTANLLNSAMLGFAARPDDMATLRARPDAIPAYIEELLRHDPPVHGVFRLPVQDVTLGGATIAAGAPVIALLGAANRDETRFPEPDRFDPGRKSMAGVAFGHGIHHCLGAALARMEGRIALEVLTARFRGVEQLDTALTWNPSLTMRGPVALRLRLLPA